jgi:hypothetical protein
LLVFTEVLTEAAFHPTNNDYILTLSEIRDLEREKIEIFTHPIAQPCRKDPLKWNNDTYKPLEDMIYWNIYNETNLKKEELQVDFSIS